MNEWQATKWRFADLVEQAWYEQTKGELCIAPENEGDDMYDAPLAALVESMRATARQYVDSTAVEQFDGAGATIDGAVSEGELARRVAVALSVLMWGTT